MKTQTLTQGGSKYTPPCCITTEITSEGVLCSSIADLDKEFEFNPWATSEE